MVLFVSQVVILFSGLICLTGSHTFSVVLFVSQVVILFQSSYYFIVYGQVIIVYSQVLIVNGQVLIVYGQVLIVYGQVPLHLSFAELEK